MKKTTLVALVLVLAVLGLSAVLLRNLSIPEKPAPLASPDIPVQAGRIEISGPNGNFAFARSGRAWRMISPVSYPADSPSIQGILDRLPDIRLSEPLTYEPSRHELFGLGLSSRTSVKIFTSADMNKAALDFDAGREGTAIDSFYLSFPAKTEVREASGLSSRAFLKSSGEWLDKKIISFPAAALTAVSVKAAGSGFNIVKKDGGWSILEGGKSRVLSTATVEEAVSPAIGALAGLEAENVMLSGLAGALPPQEMTITVSAGADKVTLLAGKSGDKDYRYLEKSGEKKVYFTVPKWKLAPLKKSAKDFR